MTCILRVIPRLAAESPAESARNVHPQGIPR
jgi:hypothetical protein